MDKQKEEVARHCFNIYDEEPDSVPRSAPINIQSFVRKQGSRSPVLEILFNRSPTRLTSKVAPDCAPADAQYIVPSPLSLLYIPKPVPQSFWHVALNGIIPYY